LYGGVPSGEVCYWDAQAKGNCLFYYGFMSVAIF